MKNKKIIFLISILCVAITIGVILGFYIHHTNEHKMHQHLQELNYAQSTEDLLNPDQGFYRTACIGVRQDSIDNKNYVITNNFQIYHLRMDISAFSSVVNGEQDLPLTSVALSGIENTLNTFFERGKNVVIRFAYDKHYNGLSNQEPSEDMILKHIEQLCPILNKFPQTITAIEAGMVGPWGEMHTSTLANSATISKIIHKFLTNTTSIPILVRTPAMIYNYLGITINDISSHTIENNCLAYRLGLFNDGYLGSSSDLGTYKNREAEIEWLSKQTSHLPYGGEVTIPNSSLHDIDKCLPEMFKMNLSYLNYEWNNDVVQNKWQTQTYNPSCGDDELYYGKTAYEYIRNHMGYRFVLTSSVFEYSNIMDKLNINLSLNNVGFGNLNKTKNLTLYFVKNDTVEKSVFVGNFNGENTIKIETDISDLNGEFSVYLALNSTQNNTSCYPIKFSNNLYNSQLNANLIGTINCNK